MLSLRAIKRAYLDPVFCRYIISFYFLRQNRKKDERKAHKRDQCTDKNNKSKVKEIHQQNTLDNTIASTVVVSDLETADKDTDDILDDSQHTYVTTEVNICSTENSKTESNREFVTYSILEISNSDYSKLSKDMCNRCYKTLTANIPLESSNVADECTESKRLKIESVYDRFASDGEEYDSTIRCLSNRFTKTENIYGNCILNTS